MGTLEDHERWTAQTVENINRTLDQTALGIIEEAVGPLEREQYRLRQELSHLYSQAKVKERELIVVTDRLNFCNATIRTGFLPPAVDVKSLLEYSDGTEQPVDAGTTKGQTDERDDDRSGVGTGSRPGERGSARAVPRTRRVR